MFVHTEEGLINLNCYSRVDIVEDASIWSLAAFMEVNTTDFSGISLAEFDEEVEARYNLCCLYSALEAGETVWDPCEVEPFLDLWDKAKKALSAENKLHSPVPSYVLNTLKLNITGLREITIKNIRGNRARSITDAEKDAVEKRIKHTLPSVARSWKIEWEDIIRE